jgi:hypothetical protein
MLKLRMVKAEREGFEPIFPYFYLQRIAQHMAIRATKRARSNSIKSHLIYVKNCLK